MAQPKLDPSALRDFIESGHTQADAAAHFGVSEAAISQRVKQHRINTSKVVAMERAGQVVEQQLTAVDNLRHAQQVVVDQLTWTEQQASQPGVDRHTLTDPIVKLSGEVRSHVRLEHDLSRTLYDLSVVQAFQRTVFTAINEESPETARRILDRLKAQQALRRSVTLSTLNPLGGFDATRPTG